MKIKKTDSTVIPGFVNQFINYAEGVVEINSLNNLYSSSSYSSYVANTGKEHIALLGFDNKHDDIERNTALRSLIDYKRSIVGLKSESMPLIIVEGHNACYLSDGKNGSRDIIKRQTIDLVRVLIPNDIGETLRLTLSPLSKVRFWPLCVPTTITMGLDRQPLAREIMAIYGYEKNEQDMRKVWRFIRKQIDEARN